MRLRRARVRDSAGECVSGPKVDLYFLSLRQRTRSLGPLNLAHWYYLKWPVAVFTDPFFSTLIRRKTSASDTLVIYDPRLNAVVWFIFDFIHDNEPRRS